MKPKLYLLLIPFLLACTLSAIPAKLAASTPRVTPVPLPTATDSQQTQQATVTANALHIRADPSYTAERVGYLKRGDVVTVTGECVDGWVPVTFEDVSGWVNSLYLSEVCK